MSRSVNMVLAGFGGQGVLFAGKLIAYAGLLEDREVSWLPSYGPEMRGGTANCSVCLSDDPIGSPLVLAPDVLVAMNQPSLDKFERSVAEGGIVVADSRYPRDGRFIEEIGIYNPTTDPAELKVDVERAQAWIKTGAQPTETVKALLKKAGM